MRLTSSNPMLAKDDLFEQYYGGSAVEVSAQAAAIKGVINKTAILVLITVAAGIAGYGLFEMMPGLMLLSGIAAAIVCIGFCFVVAGRPKLVVRIAVLFGGRD